MPCAPDMEGLFVEAADVRGCFERPHGFGVEALQGAFTLLSRQADPAAEITAEILDVSVGSTEHPVAAAASSSAGTAAGKEPPTGAGCA